MDKIFESYPKAKAFLKAGDKYFMPSAKTHAEQYAAQNGLKVEEVRNQAFADEKSETAAPAAKGANKTDKPAK